MSVDGVGAGLMLAAPFVAVVVAPWLGGIPGTLIAGGVLLTGSVLFFGPTGGGWRRR